MSEVMKLSAKTEETPLLASKGTGNNGALQLLADRYAKRLASIQTRLGAQPEKWKKMNHDPEPYYMQAENAVRALYADAT